MDSRIYILTHKRLTGQLSSIEEAELGKLSLIPENQALSEEISYLWNVSNNYFPAKDWKKEDAKKAFMERLKTSAPKAAPVSSTVATNNTASIWPKILGVAAAILLIGWAALSLLNKKEVIKADKTIEFAQVIDDTKVWLDRGARLTVLKESATERRVALEGEAFFDVAHDPSRPFTIELGEGLYAEVLGTSFRASSTHDGGDGRISVREGLVKLYAADQEMIISAGQEGVFERSRGIQAMKSTAIMPLMSDTGQITFKDTPLHEAFDKLGLHFGVDFQYQKENVLCTYTAGIPNHYTLDDVISSLTENYEGLYIEVKDRSKVQVSGACR